MSKRLIREDADGLFVVTGGYRFRPAAALSAADHAATLGWQVTEVSQHRAGDHVPAHHIAGSPVATVGDERWFSPSGES